MRQIVFHLARFYSVSPADLAALNSVDLLTLHRDTAIMFGN